ncbi:MAG: hypothetical protein ACKPKO_50375, partial [Candidatus Fonsibacter sp.]
YINACIGMSVSGVTLSSFRNNIIVNSQTSTASYGVYCAATTNISAGSVNNNCYWVPNGKVGYYNLSDRTTFSDWRTATGKDGASYNINPSFVSATNLHLNTTAS